jgi:Phage stabilisation protein
MPDFGFVGPSYEAPSIYQDAQECINFRPEIDPLKQPGQNGVVALYPTPGLTNKVTLFNTAEIRGMRTVSGGNYCVAVCGQYVYVINSTFTPTIIGTLNSSTGIVGITDNGLNVYIVDGSYRYTWRISNPSAAQFIGYTSGTTLNVTTMKSGTLAVGQQLFGIGVSPETVITALGSGSGGVGTYTINLSQTVSSQTLNTAAVAARVTGSISGTVLTVTAVTSGTLYPGQTIQGTGVTAGTIITALGGSAALSYSITSGGTGYAVGDTITVTGGIYSQQATYTVATVAAGVVTGLTTVSNGVYTVVPGTPSQTTTSGNGTGLTLTLTFGTGTGSTGSYVVSTSQTVASTSLYALNFSVMPSNDGPFTGADVVDVVDNYFVYNRPNTQQWGSTSPLSPISPSLSFSSKDGAPDNLVSIIVDHREVYLLGEVSSEVWVDSGLFPFPFQRIPGTSTQHGIAAKFSVARLGNSFAYVSRNIRGQAQIMMMNGYTPTRISTHAVENTLVDQYINDARAWTYQLEGHEVYVVSFPTLDLTWAFDISTGMWHKWLWVDNKNVFHRHRGNCHASFQGLNIVGDYENGQIYQLDPNNYTDDGNEIRRVRRAPHLISDYQRQYFAELQIHFQPGVGLPDGSAPQAMCRWSDDGGSTYSNEHWTTIGVQGAYKNRAIWRRLGQSRDRIFEVVVTDPINAVITAANLKAEAGDN